MNADDLLVQDFVSSTTDEQYQLKREKVLQVVASGRAKMYFGTDLSIEQATQLGSNEILIFYHKYESIVGSQMVKSLGHSIIKIYTKVVSSFVSLDSEEDLSLDLKKDPVVCGSLSELCRCLYFRFGGFLAPLCAGFITLNHINFSLDIKDDGTDGNDEIDRINETDVRTDVRTEETERTEDSDKD